MLNKRCSPRRRDRFYRFTECFEALEPRQLLAFDPSPMEQAFMEDVNRMRLNPQGELDVIFASLNPLIARDSEVQGAINFFAVDSQILQSQWAPLQPTHPVAWNEDLYDAAAKHNLQMQSSDQQGHHVGDELELGPRVTAEGYSFRKLNENVYAFAESHIHGHAGFIVDWGDGPGGIQSPAGHRDAMLDTDVVDVGIAVLHDTSSFTQVGPYLVTQDFGQPRVAGNPFLMGVAWSDTNNNGIYDPNEGRGGATIQITGTGGTFTTTSMSAGGYQVRVPNGTYQVSASGGQFGAARVIGGITVSGKNVKVDFQPATGSSAPIANADVLSLNEDSIASVNVLANDRYGNGSLVTGSVEIIADPIRGNITQNVNGVISYQAFANVTGTDSFRYRVRTNTGLLSNEALVNITIVGVNDPPVANSFATTTLEDTPFDIQLSNQVSDLEGGINWQSLRVTSPPSRGTATVDAANQSIHYVPASNFNGQVSLQYQVSDGAAQSNLGTVTINVTSVNDPPIANADVFATTAGTGKALTVRQNDSDPDGDLGSSVIILDALPSNGEATINGSSILYTPRTGFAGLDTVRYSLRDPQGSRSISASVNVYVTRVGRPWQNPVNALDINGDGSVALNDAILIINRIGQPLPAVSANAPPPLFDANGDNSVALNDAIQVINFVAISQPGGSPPPMALTVTSPIVSNPSDTLVEMEESVDAVMGAESEPSGVVKFDNAPLPFRILSARSQSASGRHIGRSHAALATEPSPIPVSAALVDRVWALHEDLPFGIAHPSF